MIVQGLEGPRWAYSGAFATAGVGSTPNRNAELIVQCLIIPTHPQ
jgi:hypothetical protein